MTSHVESCLLCGRTVKAEKLVDHEEGPVCVRCYNAEKKRTRKAEMDRRRRETD